MGLEIRTLRDQEEAEQMAGSWVADRRLWLTAERDRLVEDGDPAAAFLFCAPGQPVAMEEARRFGLVDPKPKAKAVEKPEDKAASPPADKGARRPYRRRA